MIPRSFWEEIFDFFLFKNLLPNNNIFQCTEGIFHNGKSFAEVVNDFV